jgi:uncharacterized protein
MAKTSQAVKIAIIGSGVSGLSAAWHLMEMSGRKLDLCIFEKDARLGGHTNTVDVTLDNIQGAVDTGFLVCNERTYPLFIPFLKKIGVPLEATDMSFAISVGPHEFEWCGSSLTSLFSQPSNVLSIRFWQMLKGVIRFNKEATRMAVALGEENEKENEKDSAKHIVDMQMPLHEFLREKGYSDAFRDDYLVPMAAAIWSCSTKTMLEFPVGSFVRFFHNHGLLQITNRPRWFTVPGGAKQYVEKIRAQIQHYGGRVLSNSGVLRIERNTHSNNNQIRVFTAATDELFDHVILACHSNQSMSLLPDLTGPERKVLSAIPYQANTAYLHTDEQLMPKRKNAWAAWNYLSEKRGSEQEQAVSVTYWLNRLQPLPFKSDVFVSLNPITLPKPESVIQTIAYEHPIFDMGSTAAQANLTSIQGTHHTWYAGAWTGFGFHEDGFRSGKVAAQALLRELDSSANRADSAIDEPQPKAA